MKRVWTIDFCEGLLLRRWTSDQQEEQHFNKFLSQMELRIKIILGQNSFYLYLIIYLLGFGELKKLEPLFNFLSLSLLHHSKWDIGRNGTKKCLELRGSVRESWDLSSPVFKIKNCSDQFMIKIQILLFDCMWKLFLQASSSESSLIPVTPQQSTFLDPKEKLYMTFWRFLW